METKKTKSSYDVAFEIAEQHLKGRSYNFIVSVAQKLIMVAESECKLSVNESE